MMVTIISPSNRSQGETGSTGGLLFSSLRHSVRAQRTARKRQDWGVCDALFCCCCCHLWWAGLGNRTNSVAENRHLLSIACNSSSSRTTLVQGYRSTATSPVFPPLYVPYVLTSTGWHRTLCAGSPVSWLLLLHHARLAGIVICRRRCSRGWGGEPGAQVPRVGEKRDFSTVTFLVSNSHVALNSCRDAHIETRSSRSRS